MTPILTERSADFHSAAQGLVSPCSVTGAAFAAVLCTSALGMPYGLAVGCGPLKTLLMPAGLPMHDTFDALNNTCRAALTRPVSFPVTRGGEQFTADLLATDPTADGSRVRVQLRNAAGIVVGRADEKLLPREPGRQPCNPSLIGFRLDLAAR